MNLPNEWCSSASKYSRNDAKLAYDTFKKVIKWLPDGNDSIIDIGCATGDVSVNVLLEILPKNFEKFICVDVSMEMIEYARQHYRNPRIQFEYLDIGEPIPEKFQQQFNHAFSFMCLHWLFAEGQQNAINNIYEMLKSGGDCLITVPGKNLPHIGLLKVSENSKWAKYMEDVKKYVTPYYYMNNPVAKAEEYLQIAGFASYDVRLIDSSYTFNSKILKDFLRSINPFLKRIPEEDHIEYINDIYDCIEALCPNREIDDSGEINLNTDYNTLYMYAKK